MQNMKQEKSWMSSVTISILKKMIIYIYFVQGWRYLEKGGQNEIYFHFDRKKIFSSILLLLKKKVLEKIRLFHAHVTNKHFSLLKNSNWRHERKFSKKLQLVRWEIDFKYSIPIYCSNQPVLPTSFPCDQI